MNVRDEIEKYADEEDKPALRWLLACYHWSSQWQFVARCTFKKYGPASYQSNRVWKPTKEGYTLFAHREDLLT